MNHRTRSHRLTRPFADLAATKRLALFVALMTALLAALALERPAQAQTPCTPHESTWQWHTYRDHDGAYRQAWGWREGSNVCWIPRRQIEAPPRPTTSIEPTRSIEPTASTRPDIGATRQAPPTGDLATEEAATMRQQPRANLANGVTLQASAHHTPGTFETNDPDFRPPPEIPEPDAGKLTCAGVFVTLAGVFAVIARRRHG